MQLVDRTRCCVWKSNTLTATPFPAELSKDPKADAILGVVGFSCPTALA